LRRRREKKTSNLQNLWSRFCVHSQNVKEKKNKKTKGLRRKKEKEKRTKRGLYENWRTFIAPSRTKEGERAYVRKVISIKKK